MDNKLIPYGEAFSRLHGRFPDLEPGELSLWVWANELSAYHPNGSPWYWAMARSLSDIVEARFRADEVDHFIPKRRYASYKTLVDRWDPLIPLVTDATPEAFIKERLDDPAQLRMVKDEKSGETGRLKLFPFDVFDCSPCSPSPIEARMFALDQIQVCERDWFVPLQKTSEERRKRCYLDAGEEWRRANPGKPRSELLEHLHTQYGKVPLSWVDEIMDLTPDIPRSPGGRPRKVKP